MPDQYGGVCGKCGARRVDRQLGLEPTPEAHVEAMVAVFREVRRVLRSDGCLLLNYGDCYACAPNGRAAADIAGDDRTFRDKPFGTVTGRPSRRQIEVGSVNAQGGAVLAGRDRFAAANLKPKDLAMMPFRVAMGLQEDGWWLRSCIPWVKRSAMPESVTDRPSTAVEYWFLLTKQERYYWDAEAVRRKHSGEVFTKRHGVSKNGYVPPEKDGLARKDFTHTHRDYNPNGRNLRNSDLFHDSLEQVAAWHRAEAARLEALRETGGVVTDEAGNLLALDINTQAFSEAHFATFPEALIRPLILASTPEAGVCSECLAPRVRVVERTGSKSKSVGKSAEKRAMGLATAFSGYEDGSRCPTFVTKGWQPSCACNAGTKPATVLDCFAGSGTTLRVAEQLGRDSIGIELSAEYVDMIRKRIDVTPALPGLWEE